MVRLIKRLLYMPEGLSSNPQDSGRTSGTAECACESRAAEGGDGRMLGFVDRKPSSRLSRRDPASRAYGRE